MTGKHGSAAEEIGIKGTVLVTGATGQQGGATARRLLGDGWPVRAFVRDPEAPAARDLARAGAELAVGDMTDRGALDAAAKGVYGVFSVQPAVGAPHFDADETRMGVNVADAALAAGARHLVYASVGGADRAGEVSRWQGKGEIEQHIRTLAAGNPEFRFTFLRPVMFMENHVSRQTGVTGANAIIRVIPPGVRVQLIAVRDIGAFAALAFADPGRYAGVGLELAGDELTREDLVAALGRAAGRELHLDPLSADTLAALGAQRAAATGPGASFAGWQADIPALRTLHPSLLDFEAWLAAEGAAKLAALTGSFPT